MAELFTPWFDAGEMQGRLVRLSPMSLDHVDALEEAASDGDLASLWYTSAPAPDGVRSDISRRLALRSQGMAPYTVFCQLSGRALGMSGYLHIQRPVRRLEIGGTWMRACAQRTGANVEAKLLFLSHAFEGLACTAVEFRTHRLNAQSRRAIEALGAQLDGVLRNHFDAFGSPRDTCVYSIIDSEWPTVRRHLLWRLSRVREERVADAVAETR